MEGLLWLISLVDLEKYPLHRKRWTGALGTTCGRTSDGRTTKSSQETLCTGYDRSRDAVVWQTHLVKIERFHYPSKSEAARIIERRFGHRVDRSEDYYQTRPARGFCVAFRVKTAKRLNLRKPKTLRFSRLGWQRVNAEIAGKWLRAW